MFKLSTYIWCLILVFALVMPLITVQAEPNLNDYAALPKTTHMALSQSGDLIAFRQRKENQQLVIITSLKKKKTVAAFDITEISLEKLHFLDEHRIIIKASENKRVANFRGSFDVSTAFIYDLKKNKLEQLLTPGEVIYAGQMGLGDIAAVSEDKKYIYMPAFTGSSSSSVPPLYSLVRVDISSPNWPKIIEKGKTSTINYFVSPTGQVLAREDYDQARDTHKVYSYLTGKPSLIFNEKTKIKYKSFVGLTPDKKSLVMSSNQKGKNRINYSTLSLKDGNITTTKWGREDADIEYSITDINNVVSGVAYSGFNPSYRLFDDKAQKKIDSILAMFPDHSVYINDWSADWKNIVFSAKGSSDPGSYYLVSGNNEPVFLTSIFDNFLPEDVHPIGKITFAARDGLKIPTLLTIPQKHISSMKKLPAVVFPHGGPESYDRIGFDGFTQALANEGYLVIQPQFRGSRGFGVNHTLAGRGEWGKKMQDDLTDAVEFFIEKGMIDRERICIAGMSYGGYAALAGGAYTPKLYKCIVSINGVSHLPKMLSWEKREHGRKHSIVSYWEEVIAKGEANSEFLKSISPYYSADKFIAPTLLVHGKKDNVVNINQSRLMKKALHKHEKEVKLIELKGESHNLENAETRTIALKEMVGFIKRNLQLKGSVTD